jgi:hypothetical protein
VTTRAGQHTVAALAVAGAITTTQAAGAGPVIDLRGVHSPILAVLNCAKASAGTSPTCAVKLQQSDTGTGSWSDVPGGAFATVTDAADSAQVLELHNREDLKRYVCAVITIGGTASPSFVCAPTLVYRALS